MITAIIQARMGSSRLPGKSLMKISGKTLIWHVVNRVRFSRYINKIVLATSNRSIDEPLLREAERIGISSYAGDENDVLDRFYQASKLYQAEIIIRITGDCPLLDPHIIDKNIEKYLEYHFDYVHSGLSFPDGIGDCEVFSMDALEIAWEKTSGSDREHVTPYIWKNPTIFDIGIVENEEDLSRYILSVDQIEQFDAVTKIYEKLYDPLKNNYFNMKDIIDYIDTETMIYDLTKNIERRSPVQVMRSQNAAKYRNSLEWLKRAKLITPSASQTYSKSYRYFCEGSAPAFLDRGKGSHVWDVDDNEYIDYSCALGAISIGYNNEEVNSAVVKQLKKGIAFSQPTVLEVELAEKLTDVIPSAEMVRFVKNGSDATATSVRIARAYTDREIIVTCGYHGYQDWIIGSTENDRGVPRACKELVKKFEYNNVDSLIKIFDEYQNKIAGVILEPIQENGPSDDFLNKIKKLTHENNAILIFDEVVSGFRVDIGGAQRMYDVTPDLTALGKGMANGLPLSACVGKRELLKLIDEGVFISTTHGGESLSIAGALATIKILEKKDSFPHMWDLGKIIKNGLLNIIKKNDLGEYVSMVGLDVHCVPSFKNVGKLSGLDLLSVFQQVMIENGILVLTSITMCVEHTEYDAKKYLDAAEKALIVVKRAIESNSVEGILYGGKINPIFKRNKDR